MTTISKLRRAWERHRRNPLLAEALVVLAASSAAIKFLPFRRVAAAAERRPWLRISGERQEPDLIHQVPRAVDSIAARVPWRAVCFQRGLAVHTMLRRRGINSALHYGVRRTPAGDVEAHVWVTVNGEAVVGGKEAPEFTCVATFSPVD